MIDNKQEVQTMRKFIATSACTILLSLLGASGLNQNSLNNINELSANSYTTSVEQNVTDTDQQAEAPIDLNKTEVKGATATNIVSKCANKGKASCQTQNCSTNNCTDSKKCATKIGKSLVYKNIDLSKCKNTNEVVKKLKANGLTNVTTKNMKDSKTLAEIIKNIEKKSTCKGGSCKSEAKSQAAKTNKATSTKTTKPVTTKTNTTATKPAATKPTTTKPTTTKPAATNSSMSSYASQVLQLVNKERAKEGLSALTTNTTLTSAADKRAKETFQSFSHTRPDGTSFSTVLKEFNISYRAAGENIAYGQKTPQEVVTGWMNSPGHRANIMNKNFGKIGIGVYKASNGRIYWSQLFTN
jgi:uncharacterized protein YkwD